MTPLRIGIASYEQMKTRTMAIARGELRPGPDEPKVWFTSMDSLAKVLLAGNRKLLRQITATGSASLDEWAKENWRKKVQPVPDPSETVAGCELVELDWDGIRPRLTFDRLVL